MRVLTLERVNTKSMTSTIRATTMIALKRRANFSYRMKILRYHYFRCPNTVFPQYNARSFYWEERSLDLVRQHRYMYHDFAISYVTGWTPWAIDAAYQPPNGLSCLACVCIHHSRHAVHFRRTIAVCMHRKSRC